MISRKLSKTGDEAIRDNGVGVGSTNVSKW